MGMLAPSFLFGLLALGVPLYLHLLRRRASEPQPFSSLLLFEPRTQVAVRHRQLRYLLLLALRLALLALVVLAFTHPYIERPRALAPASKLEVLIIDRSFSMRAGSRLADAKRAAQAVAARRRASDRIEVMSFGSQLTLLCPPTQDDATVRAAIAAIQADDSHAELSELVSAARQARDQSEAAIELHVFTDLQRSSVPSSFSEMALPDGVTLQVHSVAQSDIPNWTVVGVTAPAQVWGRTGDVKPVTVEAIVAGFATPAAERTVSLYVNGRSVASQRVAVPAGGEAHVQFPNILLPHGLSRCEVRIDSADALPEDDGYRFAIERADPQQVLFVYAAANALSAARLPARSSERSAAGAASRPLPRSALYFADALAAADGSAFSLRAVAAEAAANLSLSGYAFVVLSNLPSLPQALQQQLERYVRAGGSVLVTLGTGAAGAARAALFDAPIEQVQDYESGAVSGAERFVSVAQTDPSQSWVGSPALWSIAKFFYVVRVDATGAQVLARLTDHTPLLLEKRRGEGRVLLLASELDGLSNDLPLQPAFVAIASQIAHHLAGLEPGTGARLVDSYLQLHAAEGEAAGSEVEVIDPQGRRPLSLAEAQRTPALRLSEAGFYQLRRANGRSQLVGVNVDPRESDLRRMPAETLALWERGSAAAGGAAVADGAVAGGEAAGRGGAQSAVTMVVAGGRRERYPLWWFIMLLALTTALAESWVADRQLRSATPKLSAEETG
jgi:hypothetical protein